MKNSANSKPASRWNALQWLPDRSQIFQFVIVACCLVVIASTIPAQSFAFQESGFQPATLSPIAHAEATEAVEVASGRRGINFLTLLTRGGWFMLPLFLLSVVVATIGIERFLALRREKIFPRELVSQLSMLTRSQGGLDPRRAYQACQRHPSSASYILRSITAYLEHVSTG